MSDVKGLIKGYERVELLLLVTGIKNSYIKRTIDALYLVLKL
jgi:hypothetical protein